MFDNLSSNEAMWNYNCLDDIFTREVGETLQRSLKETGLESVDAFQHRLFPAVLHTMLRGVKIDLAARARMNKLLSDELSSREGYLAEVLGHPIKWPGAGGKLVSLYNSPKQMQVLFYDDFRLPTVWKKNEKGMRVPTLDDSALELLRRKEPLVWPIIKRIQECRSILKFRSNFVEADLEEGRMRCSYNMCGAETYRFSSSKNVWGGGCNMQTIPMGGEEDDSDLELPNVRTMFVPDDDQTFFDIDLSKADLRIVVKEADEKEMQAMLDEGRDPYIETAREFYRDPTITKVRPNGSPDPKYKMFKSFGHGTHYLGTPQGLAQRLGLTVHEATRTQAWYLGKYSAIRKWQERFVEEIKRTHSVSNKFGYRRHYFGRIDDSTFREAIAWLPQSTVGCLINRIWLNLWDAKGPVEVLLQVHDSLAGQFPAARKDESMDSLRLAGQVVIPYPSPLIIPIGIKTSEKSWGDCG